MLPEELFDFKLLNLFKLLRLQDLLLRIRLTILLRYALTASAAFGCENNFGADNPDEKKRIIGKLKNILGIDTSEMNKIPVVNLLEKAMIGSTTGIF